jgi:hypothetical protein
LEEYVMLHTTLSSVNLSNQKDVITWRWIANGQFIVAFAYACQFTGAMISFPTEDIWKAKAEPKCRFIA